MPKSNNMLVNNHFRKQWDWRVKTWFDQPAKKAARREARLAKAKAIYPRPLKALRPLVHATTQRYNAKVRFGRGFTLEELKKAGITTLEARRVGISVDFRRRNKNAETVNANAQRLKLYKSKLIVFPSKVAKKQKPGKDGKVREVKPKAGVASAEEQANAVQQTTSFPFKVVTPRDKARKISDKEKSDSAYLTLRKERGKANKVGDAIRKARAAEAGPTKGKATKKDAEDAGDD
eukprot:TRINITY_DN825_c0_g1_i1.p1 TRINITY_DN825_c0_g1~~TRINITY_DN825_c0_g1_i1.p1  ORF type:complete len:234 (+),score=57.69 TRINITY_DN825_c0_g1_i1:86-787(+)